MAPIRQDRVLVITVRATAFGNMLETTHTYTYGVADPRPDGPALDAFASAWWALVGTAYRNCVSNEVTFTDVFVVDISPTNNVEGHYLIPVGTSGNVVASVTALQVAAVISLRTAALGPSARGRIYMFGVPQTVIAAGLFIAPYISNLIAFANAYRNCVLVGAYHTTAVVFSRAGHLTRPVTSNVVNSVPDTQRRRTYGRGA